MYRNKKIGVIVPAYNEEELIGKVISSMPDYVDKIIVVDDRSLDRTRAIVREHQATSHGERLMLICHEVNQGVGGAIVSGYQKFLELDLDVAVVMAGDGQMNPADLPNLLDPLVDGYADYAKGNRLFTGDAWNKIPHIRYLGNAILSLLTKIASGYWNIADSQTGYTAATREVITTLPLALVYKRYGVPNDLLVRLNAYDFRVVDIPIEPVYGIGEKSGIRYGEVIPKISWLLLKLFMWRLKEKYVIRDFHPLVFFYAMGLICTPLGALGGFYLLALRLFHGPVEPTGPLFVSFLTLIGLQFLFFAMWFDMESNRKLGLGVYRKRRS